MGLQTIYNDTTVVGSISTSGALRFSEGTTSAKGIQFHTDVNLYRSGGNTLKTDNEIVVGTLNTSSSNSVAVENTGKLEKRTINHRVWDTGASFLSGSPTNNTILKLLSLNTVADSIISDNGTNVGIGTITPNEKCTVSGNLSASGTITGSTLSLTNNQNLNVVFAGPGTGSAGTPSFRTLVENDIPNLNASKINSGLLSIAVGGTNSSATLTNNKVMVSNSNSIVESSITTTELGYLDNVTGDIQVQINGLKDLFQLNENNITPFVLNETISGSSAFMFNLESNSIYQITYNLLGDVVNTPGTVLSGNRAFDFVAQNNTYLTGITFTNLPSSQSGLNGSDIDILSYLMPKFIITKSNPTTAVIGFTGQDVGSYLTLLNAGSYVRFQKIK